jgi:hypothetical protein
MLIIAYKKSIKNKFLTMYSMKKHTKKKKKYRNKTKQKTCKNLELNFGSKKTYDQKSKSVTFGVWFFILFYQKKKDYPHKYKDKKNYKKLLNLNLNKTRFA